MAPSPYVSEDPSIYRCEVILYLLYNAYRGPCISMFPAISRFRKPDRFCRVPHNLQVLKYPPLAARVPLAHAQGLADNLPTVSTVHHGDWPFVMMLEIPYDPAQTVSR